jgi:glucuronoxylan 4-O-methyltransferase
MHARRAKLKSQLVSAKAKLKHHVTPRRLLLLSAAAASAFLLLLTLRTLSAAAANTSSPAPVVVHRSQQQQRDDQCDRVPAGVAEALVHYATSNATAWGRGRRRSAEEVAATARAVSRRAPCNLLVFGLGHGAALWAALNHGGRTVFLEEDDALVSGASPASLAIEAYRVAYLASAADADELLALRDSEHCTGAAATQLSPGHFDRSPCKLAVRGLPAAFYEAEWDVIVVDAHAPPPPTTTAMMGAIYTAAVAARARRPAAAACRSTSLTGDVLPMEPRLNVSCRATLARRTPSTCSSTPKISRWRSVLRMPSTPVADTVLLSRWMRALCRFAYRRITVHRFAYWLRYRISMCLSL